MNIVNGFCPLCQNEILCSDLTIKEIIYPQCNTHLGVEIYDEHEMDFLKNPFYHSYKIQRIYVTYYCWR